jgi:transposase-like protein
MTTDRIKEIQSKTAYPDSISVQQALLQVWNECEQEQLRIANVVGQSEQLTCPRCKSTNCLTPDKENDAECNDCGFIWAG